MYRRVSEQPLAQVVVALVTALIFAPVVGSITAGLRQTMGHAWPFSLERCAAQSAPACVPASDHPIHTASNSAHWASR